MIRRPPRSTHCISSAASDVYKRQGYDPAGIAKAIFDAANGFETWVLGLHKSCLLYTSDAADDMQCVDLGGRRIIKKDDAASATPTKNIHSIRPG